MSARRHARVEQPVADVAVLGGGPAGAAAARLLATWGHSVVLLTRPAPGPPLAESLTPSCAGLLERIGILDAMDGTRFVRSTGHRVRWGTTTERAELFPGGARGWQVSRDAFDSLLLRKAKAGGARVSRHANVRDVRRVGTVRRVTYEERGRSRQVDARWVVDCTGRAGLMSRGQSGRRPAGARTMAIVGLWERRPAWGLDDDTQTLVESYDGGWAWSVPLSRTRRQVTVMLDPTRTQVAGGGRLHASYRRELARTVMLRVATARARFLGSPWARDASSYDCAEPVRGRLLVAGDAASFIDPLSSYGVKKALASGWLAAVVVHSSLLDPGITDAALDLFAGRERAIAAALRRQFDALAAEAKAAHGTGFWDDRGVLDPPAVGGDPDVAALRLDPRVRRAFDAIRARETLAVVPAPSVRRVRRPLVRDDRVVVVEHLATADFPDGIRYVRNVDLLRLAELAPGASDVPSLLEAYIREAGSVPLPDFLGSLAVLIGLGMLRFA